MEDTSIKFIRLTTGEDLVADTTHVSDGQGPDYVVLSNPLKIVYIQNQLDATRVGVSLMQWVFSKISANQEFKIMVRDIITMSDASDTLIGYYNDFMDSFDEAQKKFDKSNASHDISDQEWQDLYESDFIDTTYSSEEPDVSEQLSDGEGLSLLTEFLEELKKGKKNLH